MMYYLLQENSIDLYLIATSVFVSKFTDKEDPCPAVSDEKIGQREVGKQESILHTQ